MQKSTKDLVTKSCEKLEKDTESENQISNKGDEEQNQVSYMDSNTKKRESQVEE